MKGLFFALFVALILPYYIEAGVSFSKATVSTGKCLGSDQNEYAVGEYWYNDEECIKLQCHERDEELWIRQTSCGVKVANPPCQVVDGPGGRYPNCCPVISCSVNQSSEEEEVENEP